MADVVNLKRARKDKARRERTAEAAANRARFGRTKAEKAADADQRARRERLLSGKLIETETPDEA